MDAFPVNELAVFRIAFSIESDELREEYLQQVCREDRKLYNRVAELLRASQKAPEFLESPAAGVGPTVDCLLVAERPGQTIDRYKLLQEIGEGGFGVVYMAEQQQPVCRKVALKIIKPGMDTKQVIARFEAEEQALAMMDHPNIAKVHDAGVTESGRPYFVMELVHGTPLTDYCDQNQLTTNQRLELFVSVCRAIQHAHQKGIIHRDIKPSNVMVTLHDGVPVPKIIDFGIAKATDRRLTERTLFTSYGQIVGTPLYMSPEQAEMSGLDIDTRSDIYSLGAVLYELLTGSTPFDQERIRAAGYDEMRRMIREEEPPRPSARLSTLAAGAASTISTHRRTDATKLSHLLRGELDWVVMKALEKDRARRYDTANDLAKDVQRYLNDEPVEACPPSTAYRLGKFARRHKATLATIAAFTALLLVAVAARLWVNQKDAALAQVRADVARRISAELSTARALRGDVQSGSLPDSQTLTRALEAAQSAQLLLPTGQVDEETSTQVTELLTSLKSQKQDQDLLVALEETWQWELDQLAEQGEIERHSIAVRARSSLGSGDARQREREAPGAHIHPLAAAGAATLYEEAFARWGLEPRQTTLADATRRIQALHPTYRASVLVSFDRWRTHLGAPRSLREWEPLEWSVLEPVELMSRGGDSLEVQPDGSILASGDQPQRGYDLVLQTDQHDIVALRLEAMLDDSLPGRGPGRGWTGTFAMDGLRVWYAPKANPDEKKRLEFRSAVADYTDPSFPLTTESWRAEGGKAHIAVFEVEEPVHSDSGFRLTISHQDGEPGWRKRENQNLGRFRWSVSADRQDELAAQWLAMVVDQADRDDWRRSMRSEIQRGDIAALVQRASDPQAFLDQPEIILVQFAKALREIDDTILFELLPDTINWEVLKPTTYDSEEGAELELQPDDSIFSGGDRNPQSDTLVITAPVGRRPISAIRLEAIPDHRLPSGGAGRGNDGGEFALAEFKAEVLPASNPDDKEPLVFDRAIADSARSPAFSLSKAVDGLRRTAWFSRLGHPQSHTAIFVTAPSKVDGEMILRVCLESDGGWRSLGRFRLSVTHDPIHLPDPNRAALALLQYIHPRHPDNYWVNLALAETLSQQTPPALDEAIRYATAALALRPENATSHATLLRVLPTNRLDPDRPLGQPAIYHARRVRERDPDHASLQYAASQQADLGRLLRNQGKLDEAIAKFNLAIELKPSHAGAYESLGNALASQGKLKEAIVAFRHSLDNDRHNYHAQYGISNALLRQGEVDQAIDAARKALEICPMSTRAHRSLIRALGTKGSMNEATDVAGELLDLWRDQGVMGVVLDILFRDVESGSTDPFFHFEVGFVRAEEGKLDEAIDAFRKAIDLDPEHGLALYYLGNALRQQGRLEEAAEAYREAIKIDAKYAHAHRRLVVALIAQDDFKAARDALQEYMGLTDRGDSRDWFFFAMSKWQLGDKEEALRWYGQAADWMYENDPDNEELAEARAEAEKTLGLKEDDAERED